MQRRYVQASSRRKDLRTALLFGGAFNPPTIAHIGLAEYARELTGKESVIFVPTKNSYISDTQGKEYVFSDEDRLFMLDQIALNRPWMEVSRFEIEAEKQPRTYETLCHFRKNGVQASLLFGSDKLAELQTVWKYVPEICREFGIVCMKRSDDDPESLIRNDPFLRELASCITIIDTPETTREVSSTNARRSLAAMKQAYGEIREILPAELHGLMLEYVKKGDGK